MIVIAKVDKHGDLDLLDGTIFSTESEAAEYLDNYGLIRGMAYEVGFRVYELKILVRS